MKLGPPMPRPNCPRACAVQVQFCGDPNCWPHVIALDEYGDPLVEIILPRGAINDIKRWDREYGAKKMAERTYDEKCYELASHFLSDEPTLDDETNRDLLAAEIQQCIEDEIARMKAEAGEAA